MACRHLYLVEGDQVGSATPLLTHIVHRFQEQADALPVLFIAARQPPPVWALHLRRLGVPVQALVQARRLHLLDYAALLQPEDAARAPGDLVGPQACAAAQLMIYRAAAGLARAEEGLLVVVDDVQAWGWSRVAGLGSSCSLIPACRAECPAGDNPPLPLPPPRTGLQLPDLQPCLQMLAASIADPKDWPVLLHALQNLPNTRQVRGMGPGLKTAE